MNEGEISVKIPVAASAASESMGSIDAFSTGATGFEALQAGRCVGVVRQKTHRKKSQRAGVFLFGEESRFFAGFRTVDSANQGGDL
jgi:hypothetical protein